MDLPFLWNIPVLPILVPVPHGCGLVLPNLQRFQALAYQLPGSGPVAPVPGLLEAPLAAALGMAKNGGFAKRATHVESFQEKDGTVAAGVEPTHSCLTGNRSTN